MHQQAALHDESSIRPILPLARALLAVCFAGFLMLAGCGTAHSHLDPVAPELAFPVIVFDPPAPLQEAISLDSPNAAMRLIALRREHPLERRSIGDVDIHLDEFRMIDWEEEAELDPAAHRRYLLEQQGVIASITEASRLDRFDLYPNSPGYRGRIEQDGPRTGMLSWIGIVRKLLKDDAVRAWIDGDRDAALDRVETMVRLARQVTWTSYADQLDRLYAQVLLGSSLDLLDAMLHHPATTNADRARMRAIVGLLDGRDPLGQYEALRRVVASYDLFVATGIAEPDGSPALWLVVGQIHAVDAATQLILKPHFGGLPSAPGNSDDVSNTHADQAEQLQALIDSIVAELDDLTIRDLRNSYRRAQPQVRTALDELAKENPDLEVFRTIRDKMSTDETGIPEVLHLPFLRSIVGTTQRILAHRDQVRAALME